MDGPIHNKRMNRRVVHMEMRKGFLVSGMSVISVVLAMQASSAQAFGAIADADTSSLVTAIKVQPDKAPDCSTLKTIVESVTRGCANNDAKAVAIYNFILLSMYHQPYANENGGIPTLKVIHCYGWGVCGGTAAVMSSLWRELGWGWRFIGWPGHTTVEAKYDDRWHYIDSFYKWYIWEPDGKGGQTIASEEEIAKNRKALYDDVFLHDAKRKVGYVKTDAFVMVNGKANWQARDYLDCDDYWLEKDANGLNKESVPAQRSSPCQTDGWGGYNHATGSYSTDVNLSPGFSLVNTWDRMSNAWYWVGMPKNYKKPGHSCGGHKDTRNNPGIGLVIEPYTEDRGWANGTLSFSPDFAKDSFLKSFFSVENVIYSDHTLKPSNSDKPAFVVVRMTSPYIMTLGRGTATGADTVELSTDEGKTYKTIELDDFSKDVKGKMSALVKIGFKGALKALNLAIVIQNTAQALPYLSPGKNQVTVSVANPRALGENQLVVTYAYRLGSRDLSPEEICEQGKKIANQSGASWSDTVTYVRKIFLSREVIPHGGSPLPLPDGAEEAKPASQAELVSLPNPFMLGTRPPPVAVETK